MNGVIPAIFAIFALFFVLLVLAMVYSSRYKKVGPNEVLIISGRGTAVMDPASGKPYRRTFRVVRGGGTFIWPVLERTDHLSLELMTIEIVTPNVYTMQGVPVTVDGVAQVKIGSDDVSIVTAAEQFLSKKVVEIQNVALQTLEGHLRAIVGAMTVEEIYKDRDKFAQRVQEVSALDMKNMGLTIVSFTIKNIHDENGYLDALGQARIAEVKRDAVIGQANAQRDVVVAGLDPELHLVFQTPDRPAQDRPFQDVVYARLHQGHAVRLALSQQHGPHSAKIWIDPHSPTTSLALATAPVASGA